MNEAPHDRKFDKVFDTVCSTVFEQIAEHGTDVLFIVTTNEDVTKCEMTRLPLDLFVERYEQAGSPPEDAAMVKEIVENSKALDGKNVPVVIHIGAYCQVYNVGQIETNTAEERSEVLQRIADEVANSGTSVEVMIQRKDMKA